MSRHWLMLSLPALLACGARADEGRTTAEPSTTQAPTDGVPAPLPPEAPGPTAPTPPTGRSDFDEFLYDEATDPKLDRLCPASSDPAGTADKTNIACRIVGDRYATASGPPNAPRVLAFNAERGLALDAQLAWLTAPTSPQPDVLLLNEVDRGCSRSGFREVARAYAKALHMNFVYGVEFVELPRAGGSGGEITAPCEHGNAILARYPIGNVSLHRHQTNKSWYAGEEPRLGGRMFLTADLLVGASLFRVYSIHFESGASNAERAAQAAEVAMHAKTFTRPAVIGGDMNAATYAVDLALGSKLDPTTQALFVAGFLDAHAAVPAANRATHDPALVLDLLVGRNVSFNDAGLCPRSVCASLSDHSPVWANVDLH